MKCFLALVLALAPACDSHRVGSAPDATVSFADQKAVRLLGIHNERALLGAQPDMIATFAEQLSIDSTTRTNLGARIDAFASAMTRADEAIALLETATPATFAKRDEDVVVAMRHLETARDAAWSALRAARSTPSS